MASKVAKLIPFSTARSPSLLRRVLPFTSATGDLLRSKIPNHQFAIRSFSSRPSTSSLNDPSPNWSNRPPKETILLDGCDFNHWLCVVEPPDPNWTRDQLIDHYIKILAKAGGTEEEARMKIYSVSTKHYFAFGANVSEEVSYKLKELPELRWVLPDSYLDVKNKDYGGEPFINGEAVPYDPKYHEEWVRNNARANERSRRNDRPRNFDRSRNFERRGEMRSGGGPAPPMHPGNPNPNALPAPQNAIQSPPPPMQTPNFNRPPPSQGPAPPMHQGNPNPNALPAPQNAIQSPPPPMQTPNFNRPPPSQGPPSPNVGYQNQFPNPNYHDGGGGYQPSPNPNMPPPPPNPNFNRPPPPPAQNYYQGGDAPGYQQGGGAPGYQQGGAPGYQQSSAPAYQQGGAPAYQSNAGGYSNYQGNPYPNPNPNPNPTQSGGGAYQGGNAGGLSRR